MATRQNHTELAVWVWLPGQGAPVLAGELRLLDPLEEAYQFHYVSDYVARADAIAFCVKDLPLQAGKVFSIKGGLPWPLRDSLPDAWGRRLLQHRYPGFPMNDLDRLLLSSHDRIGALHFQLLGDDHAPPLTEPHATLEQLIEITHFVEAGEFLPPSLDIALNHGTSVGGARPKALIDTEGGKYLAKFSSSTDTFPVVQYEYAMMLLARRVGINVADVELVTVQKKHALLVKRFDRCLVDGVWSRRFMTSALTLLRLHESEGRYASYLDLAGKMRECCADAEGDLRELFRRLVFNILVGNTDDHAKNHAFFWDGACYVLTPAYDICPYPRAGQEATQAMVLGSEGARSQLVNALSGVAAFGLEDVAAREVIDNTVDEVKSSWGEVCDEAGLTELQKQQLQGTAILNPFVFYGY